jgi:uncharacterized protein (DUF3820 family)
MTDRIDNYRIKFGKYKGKKLKDIPFDYLRWVGKLDNCPKPIHTYNKKHEEYI